MTGWLPSEIYGVRVERHFIPRPGNAPVRAMPNTGRFVLHSTEGLPKFINPEAPPKQRKYRFDDWTQAAERSAFEGAIRSLTRRNIAPHFTVGDDRIAQHRQIGQQGSALRGGVRNGETYIQVEISANTEGRKGLWLPTPRSLRPLVALLAYSFKHLGIPPRVPNAWPDDMRDCPLPWATRRNARRSSGVWAKERGVFMHLEVPDNDHFDCALMERTRIIQMALDLAAADSALPVALSPADGSKAVLRFGDSGKAVRDLKGALAALGHLSPALVNDRYDENTRESVRMFQEEAGIDVDGIAGPQTRAALSKALAKKG